MPSRFLFYLRKSEAVLGSIFAARSGRNARAGVGGVQKFGIGERDAFFTSQALDIPQNRQRNLWKNLTKSLENLTKSLEKLQKICRRRMFHVKQTMNARNDVQS
jgi:hypothetical protein